MAGVENVIGFWGEGRIGMGGDFLFYIMPDAFFASFIYIRYG